MDIEEFKTLLRDFHAGERAFMELSLALARRRPRCRRLRTRRTRGRLRKGPRGRTLEFDG